jgi:GAF domain-containing protein
MRIAPYRTLENVIDGVVITFVDITRIKQTEDALRESEKHLGIWNRITGIFLTFTDEDMYGEVLQVVLKAMQSPYGTFAYLNEAGDRVVPSMTRDIWEECQMEAKDINFPHGSWGDVIWARCIKEKKSFASNGPFTIPDGHIPITRALAVPIIHHKEAIGNLMVGNKPTDYTDKDMNLLELIASPIAPILDARLKKTNHF